MAVLPADVLPGGGTVRILCARQMTCWQTGGMSRRSAHHSVASEEKDEQRGLLPAAIGGRRSAGAAWLLRLHFDEKLGCRGCPLLLTMTHERGTFASRKRPGVTCPSNLPDGTRGRAGGWKTGSGASGC
eukprot:1487778-Pleurochrysis_carterae.AAC.2